jgi:hypothetical protein
MRTDSWTVFIVYGEFHEPTSKAGGLVVRMPSGKVPWKKKIVPAIAKLIRPWSETKSTPYWNVEGDLGSGEDSLWITKAFARYEWDGEGLVRVGDGILGTQNKTNP